MGTPHVHAELIKAWADGADIQVLGSDGITWFDINRQPLWIEDAQYRIKPDPKPDVVRDYCAIETAIYFEAQKYNLRLTFDGETGRLKAAEVL